MADRKRKITFLFRNTRHENRISRVVKLIKEWVLNARKSENVFLWNDKTQIISKICYISRSHLFNKKSLLQLNKREAKILILFDFDVLFRRSSAHISIWFWQNGNNCQTFQLGVRAHCVNDAKSLGFHISSTMKLQLFWCCYCTSHLHFY